MEGNIRGEWKKFGVGGKHIFQMFFVLSQRYLSSLAKPVEFGLFTLQLAVVHTAPYVHNGEVHRVLF